MPIYEFHCADCNVLFNFFSSRIDTEKRPNCPRCGRERLERRPARFSTARRSGTEDVSDPLEELGDDGLDRLMENMAGELESLGDSDAPKHYARILRKMGQSAGLELGPRMEELLGRLDAGTNLDDIESELESDEPDADGEDFEDYFRLKKKLVALRRKRPQVDNELYFL